MKQIYNVLTILVLLICSGTASAWLSGYDHRMAITVNNGGASTLTNYQFNFTNDTNALVAAGHMQVSGADCRITDHLDNLIPFWNETAFNASGTKIWANATTLAVGSNMFYMYYGNAAVSPVADIGSMAYVLGDDMTGLYTKSLVHNNTIRNGAGATHINYINTFEINGDHAYCAVYGGGTLTTLNISNPALVTETGFIACFEAHDIKLKEISGTLYAFVVTYTGHDLVSFNVNNPASMSQLDSIDVGGTHGFYLYIEGDYAYVTIYDSGTATNNCLKIYDISDPTNLVYVSQICHDGTNLHMRQPWNPIKKDDYIYIGNVVGTTRTNILNVSDVNNPSYVGYFNDGNFDLDPMIRGDYMFSSGGGGYLKIYNVSSPTSPVEISSTNLNVYEYHKDVSADGNYVYIRSGTPTYIDDNGVKIIDVSDKNSPVEVASIYGAGAPGYYNRCHFNRIVGNTLFSVGYQADSFITTDVTTTYSIDTDKWDGNTGDAAISGETLTLNGSEKYIHGKTNVALPFIFETRVKAASDAFVGAMFGTGDEISVGSGGYETFTGYTEVDPNTHITVETNKLTGAGVARNEDAYVYKDFGVDNFNALNIQFEIQNDGGDASSYLGHVCAANVIDDVSGFGTTDVSILTFDGSTDYIYLLRGNWIVSDRYAMSVGTTYYCTLKRTAASDTVTLEIRTGSHTGSLVDTLSMSGFGTGTKWRYMYGINSYNTGNSEAANGWTQNVCLSPPCGAANADAAPKNGTLYRTQTSTDKAYTRSSESWADKGTVSADLDAYQVRKFVMTDSNVKVYYNDILDKTITTDLSNADMSAWFQSNTSADILIDWAFIRKYAATEPTASLGAEEDAPTGIIYIPPDPINFQHTIKGQWVNYTWAAGSGNVTDSYSVLYNNVWYNGSGNTYKNNNVVYGTWSNISVWAWNNTDIGTLSLGSVSQNTYLASPNNYIPPNSLNINNVTGSNWIKHTWSVGSGNITDSYNVSINEFWYNDSTNTYYQITYASDAWQNITVWAWNNSHTGSLSLDSISQNTFLKYTVTSYFVNLKTIITDIVPVFSSILLLVIAYIPVFIGITVVGFILSICVGVFGKLKQW